MWEDDSGRGGDGAAAFAELGARSNFSLLDGASHPEELVGTAAALGLAGLAVCDTNSLAGAVRAHAAAKRAGLRFTLGARLLLDDGFHYLVPPFKPPASDYERIERRPPATVQGKLEHRWRTAVLVGFRHRAAAAEVLDHVRSIATVRRPNPA